MKKFLEKRNTKGEGNKEYRLPKMEEEQKQSIILEKTMRHIMLQNPHQMETWFLQGSQSSMEFTRSPINQKRTFERL